MKIKKKVPFALGNFVKEAFQQDFIKENDMIVEVYNETFDDIKMVETRIKVSNYKPSYSSAPTLGMHNYKIYHELWGMSKKSIEKLKSAKII